MMFTYIDICYFLGLIVLISCVFKNHWLKEILRFSNSSNLLFFIYPCSTWLARIGMFCILKPLLKSKSNIRKFSAYFTLIFILYIILFYFNSVFSFFSCIAIKKSTSYLHLLRKLPKMVKVIMLLSLCLPNLLLCCDDIEKNPGPKYSSLNFCHWNLNGLKAQDSIKISLLQAYII